MEKNQQKLNHLAGSSSPYLKRHATNPIDWYPWGNEAFERARMENKPIFLSIGYSACHWCHVMEKESFEDFEIAQLMNDSFVCVKVDREERPDIDNIYMSACQLMGGGGGWPLTVVMTPDLKPFFAATYIPKESAHGRIGLKDLIPALNRIWKTEKNRVEEVGQLIVDMLQTVSRELQPSDLSIDVLHRAYESFQFSFDDEYGGFGTAPKFPTPHKLMFLMRYYLRTGEKEALEMVHKTLRNMRYSGLYDHLGFGFHRYSTDRKWRIPHFEKMLYDQALLALTYLEAFQIMREKEFERTAKEILDYVVRDLRSPDGAFFSSEDADSNGVEGGFYLWRLEEMKQILDEEEFAIVKRIFDISNEGNFALHDHVMITGANILYMIEPFEKVAFSLNITPEELNRIFERARQRLLEKRIKRGRPERDEKILTDWNALMIVALARAASIFGDEKMGSIAKEAADFIIKVMIDGNGRLHHSYAKGLLSDVCFLDDYAFFTWALLELYELTFEPRFLRLANSLAKEMKDLFWDEENGGFFMTLSDAPDIIVRQKEGYDGSIPSGNSVASIVLLKLAQLLDNDEYKELARRTISAFSSQIIAAPDGFSMMLCALELLLGPRFRVMIIESEKDISQFERIIGMVKKEFLPNIDILYCYSQPLLRDELAEIVPAVRDAILLNDKTTVYVCSEKSCFAPTTNVNVVLDLIGKRRDITQIEK
ncbi:MAG: thioredoxin domain-containing protein [Methanomassiliicoccales archaeon]|nr:thioredoxin domain-containing protein [Methanomassiliicoccales archaeon]